MPLSVPTYDELKSIAEDALRDKASITNFSESSVIGTLVNVNAAFVADLYNLLVQMEAQSNLSSATGIYLDRLGLLFGIKRLPAKAATTTGAGRAVVFMNDSASTVTIPERTRVWSPKDYNVAFYTTGPVSIPASSRAYVDVSAAGAGMEFNVGPESLTQHNLSNTSIRVTNVLSIANGMSVETDDNYRYRISNAMLAKAGSNATAIRMRILEIPGVKDVVIQPLVRGTGTVDAVIIPVGRRITQELLDSCQEAMDEVVAFGISSRVKGPIERAVDLSISTRVSSTGDPTLVRALVSASARSYIDNLGVGDTSGDGDIVYNELISRMMNSHQDVSDITMQMKIDGKLALNVNQIAKAGERFYLQSIKVV